MYMYIYIMLHGTTLHRSILYQLIVYYMKLYYATSASASLGAPAPGELRERLLDLRPDASLFNGYNVCIYICN